MSGFGLRVAGGLFLCAMLGAGASAQGWRHLGNVHDVEKLQDGMELTAGPAKIRITSFREGIVRVRVAPTGKFPEDFSWAIVEQPQPVPVAIEDGANTVHMTAGEISIQVNKAPLLIKFSNTAGATILEDEPSLPMAFDGDNMHIWKRMPLDENYFGLGDKAGHMNRRNRAFTMWNTDEFGWQESSDPLYKDIPFFIGLRKGAAYGVFFDNAYRSSFDFGKESLDYFSFGAAGGELNYYYFSGPEPKKIITNYTAMVGHAPLPPLWSLGFQQSRYSYYPEARAREIVQTYRQKKIPLDAIYFDIDYQQGNAPFTVNRQYFPNFEKMIEDFRAQGVRTVLITDLHIKKDANHNYTPYDSGMQRDMFVKNPDGSVFVGLVWPGDSVFPDFTRTKAREWWGEQYQGFVGMGVAGFWNDMNEPSVFKRADKTMPLGNLHGMDDGTTRDHRAIHNIYGMENVRATYDGLRKLQPDERPFVLTRAAYSGTEKYAATWTGDNSSTWNHLSMSTPMLLSLGICGYSIAGDDIGGFAGTPTADLLTRWIEVGAFNPIYRDHTAKGTADQEPWVHGPEHEMIRRRYIELRYQLLPYIYTGMEEMTRTGLPFMRPLFLEYPQASGIEGNDHDFLFGRDLFVAPVTTEMLDAKEVNLPPGDWYDFWTSSKPANHDHIQLHPRLEELPLYVRAGAILPMQPLVQSTSETPAGPLKLRVYPGDDCRGALYMDDGHTYAYQKNEFLRVEYSCQTSGSSVTVNSKIVNGAYHPWWNSAEIIIYGAAVTPKEARIGGQVIRDFKFDSQTHAVTLTVPDAVKDWSIQISY
ncbi:MAG: glycoside hydrolase family 31 protein [Acidobacteriota bacterium]|nr:glycoside hydrolase family 31 protein [Acidobacteriota bacterium]